MRTRFAALSLAALYVSSMPGTTRTPVQDSQDKQEKSQGFVLEAGEHHIQDILDRAAKFLGRNYLMPTQVIEAASNTIRLQKKLNLDAIGCEEVVSQLLYSKDFAITPMDPLRNIYEVIFLRGAKRPEVAARAMQLAPDEVLRKSNLWMQVVTAVHLKHIDAARAGQQLRPFLAGAGSGASGVQFGSAVSHQTLLLQGFAPQVAMAIRLLRQVDQPQEKVFPSDVYSRLSNHSANIRSQTKTIKDLQRRLAILESLLAQKK